MISCRYTEVYKVDYYSMRYTEQITISVSGVVRTLV